jgi:hypothetical protein
MKVKIISNNHLRQVTSITMKKNQIRSHLVTADKGIGLVALIVTRVVDLFLNIIFHKVVLNQLPNRSKDISINILTGKMC